MIELVPIQSEVSNNSSSCSLRWSLLHRVPEVDPTVGAKRLLLKPYVYAVFVKQVLALKFVELITFDHFVTAD